MNEGFSESPTGSNLENTEQDTTEAESEERLPDGLYDLPDSENQEDATEDTIESTEETFAEKQERIASEIQETSTEGNSFLAENSQWVQQDENGSWEWKLGTPEDVMDTWRDLADRAEELISEARLNAVEVSDFGSFFSDPSNIPEQTAEEATEQTSETPDTKENAETGLESPEAYQEALSGATSYEQIARIVQDYAEKQGLKNATGTPMISPANGAGDLVVDDLVGKILSGDSTHVYDFDVATRMDEIVATEGEQVAEELPEQPSEGEEGVTEAEMEEVEAAIEQLSDLEGVFSGVSSVEGLIESVRSLADADGNFEATDGTHSWNASVHHIIGLLESGSEHVDSIPDIRVKQAAKRILGV